VSRFEVYRLNSLLYSLFYFYRVVSQGLANREKQNLIIGAPISIYEVKNLIKKILVALDGSDQADHALDFALELADQYSGEIQLLTVVPRVFLPVHTVCMPACSVITSEAIAEVTRHLETCSRGVLSKAQEKVKKEKPDLKVSTIFEHGDPDEKIVEMAKREKFDIIVMGSRGVGRREYGLGSVSSRVADNATCPVLIVK